MPDQPIVVRPSETNLRVSGQRLEDFPNTGTYISIEKLSGRSVFIEGQKGTSTRVRMSGKGYRVSLTFMQFSFSDRYMFNAARLLADTNGLLELSLNSNGMKYVSGSCDIETEPNRELAGDSSPFMTWTLVGDFPIVVPGVFVAPPIITSDQILSFAA